jgi:hypothetical protein
VNEKSASASLGPEVYGNWIEWQKDHKDWMVFEYPFFADAHVTGELSDLQGPYQFFNMVPPSLGAHLAPTVMLRIAQPRGIVEMPPMKRTNDSRYHGGTIVDEIAALLSLQLGVRFKAGKMIRIFDPAGDPKGRPRDFEMIHDLVTPRYLPRPVIPSARGEHSLNKDDLFIRLLELQPVDAIALVRAGRMYQDALWISESQPTLAWLYLVCSVEIAANHWRKEKESPIERLRASRPKVIEILMKAGKKKLVEPIANELAPYMGAIKKFVDFTMNYLPQPPEKRPPVFAQFKWDATNMKKALSKIYSYRSKALHSGKPFPILMCDPPMKHQNEFAEKPPGLAASARGGVWAAKDIPMLLCTFEYIARNVLLSWWRSMLEPKIENLMD